MIEAIQARLAEQSEPGPKYQVLRDAIVGAISGGDWTPGMRLPTEAELADVLPYSLGTVQKAYGELVKNGLVVRSRGRGSFVAPAQRQMSDPWHCRFLDDDGKILPIYPRILGHKVATEDRRWAELFGETSRWCGSTAPSRSTTNSRSSAGSSPRARSRARCCGCRAPRSRPPISRLCC